MTHHVLIIYHQPPISKIEVWFPLFPITTNNLNKTAVWCDSGHQRLFDLPEIFIPISGEKEPVNSGGNALVVTLVPLKEPPDSGGSKGRNRKFTVGAQEYLKPIWIGLFFFWAHFSHFSFKPNTYKHFFNIPKHSKSLKAIFYHLSFHPCHGGAQQVDIQCSSGNIGPLPTKYLDLSLEEKYKSLSIWNNILEKLEKSWRIGNDNTSLLVVESLLSTMLLVHCLPTVCCHCPQPWSVTNKFIPLSL